MKKLTTEKGVFGPYADIELDGSNYLAGRNILPVSVVGEGTISDWDGPLPELTVNEDVILEQRDNMIRSFEDRHSDKYKQYHRQIRMGVEPTVDLAHYDAYVQALSDVTDQPGWPDSFTWPEEPA